MLILQLLVAHLLGDFVFQSNALLKRKYESWKGTFEHALIITLFTALALFPYWEHARTWIAVGTIFLVHFIQDVIKVEVDKRYVKGRSTVPFFVDQLLHISLIVAMGRGFENLAILELPYWVEWLYFSPAIHVLFAGLIMLTYTFDITLYQFKHMKNRKLKYHPDHKGMMQRVLAFSIFYLVLMLLFQFNLFT